MKQILLPLLFFLGFAGTAIAQRTVSGTILDESNEGLIGASVIIKGTSTGTVTDFDGRFTLEVPEGKNLLEISYIGYVTQTIELGTSNVVNVTLAQGIELTEVIVTALGISKAEKSLGYAVSSVATEEINRTGDINPLAGLKGKVPGIDISSANGQPGSSSKVRIRGVGSITGSASPLIVIDGVPQFDNFTGIDPDRTGSLDRQVDFGNSLGDLNPTDIENISVLKGAAAAALYGSRAGSGVIIVTTKNSSYNQALKVDYSGSYTRSAIGRLQHKQDIFGQGWSGVHDLNENGSWGPKYDGQDRLWGKIVDNQQQVRSYKYRGDDALREAFDIGTEWQHSIGFSAGTETAKYRVSFTNTEADGVIPTDQDSYSRQALALTGGLKVGKLEITSSINFQRKSQKVVTVAD